MKKHMISKLGSGLTVALLLGGCIQTDDIFLEERQDSETGLTDPLIHAQLSHIDGGCDVASDEGASTEMVVVPVSPVTCSKGVPRGGLVQLYVYVDWREQPFGSIQVSDACGIAVDLQDPQPWSLSGTFQAPPMDTQCTLTVDAVDGDGHVLSSTTMNFNVAEPLPRPSMQASIVFAHEDGECQLTPGQTEVDCEAMPRGERATIHVEVDWDTATPGTLELWDCGGEFEPAVQTSEILEGAWVAPLIPGAIGPGEACTVGVEALSPDGWSQFFELRVPLI